MTVPKHAKNRLMPGRYYLPFGIWWRLFWSFFSLPAAAVQVNPDWIFAENVLLPVFSNLIPQRVNSLLIRESNLPLQSLSFPLCLSNLLQSQASALEGLINSITATNISGDAASSSGETRVRKLKGFHCAPHPPI